jgi:hypothetical protein
MSKIEQECGVAPWKQLGDILGCLASGRSLR